jgi:hypothetical protein
MQYCRTVDSAPTIDWDQQELCDARPGIFAAPVTHGNAPPSV